MDYFSHDTNALGDKKIEALRMLYGNDGYAFYFILLEMIYQEPNFELDVSDAETIQILAKKVEVTIQKFESILETSIKRECFDPKSYKERKVLTSNGIKKRASVVVEKRVNMRKKYEQKVSDAEIGVESTQRKGKESKRKVKDICIYRQFKHLSLTQDEFDRLISEGYTKETIDDTLDSIENYKKNTNYTSLNLTVRKWLKKEGAHAKNKGSQNTGLKLYQAKNGGNEIKSEVKPSRFYNPEMSKMLGQ